MSDPIPDFPFPRPHALEPPTGAAELRERCPVAHVRLPSGDVASLLTRYEDAHTVLTDPRFVRAAPGAARLSTNGLFSGGGSDLKFVSDGPEHTRWRRLLGRSFTIRKMAALRPTVQAMADDLVDGMVSKGSPANLRTSFALPLPVKAICALVGAPSEDQDRFAHWSDVMISLTNYDRDEVARAYREFDAYVLELINQKRAATEPSEDLLTELLAISDSEDGGLSDVELVATVALLLSAGHETTANMIAIMTALLLADRERFEAVIADETLIPGTVEECLRFDSALSPVGAPRFASEDVELGETSVPVGTTVIPNKPFANRDPRKFPDPDRFDPRRDNAFEHLAFGAGPYFCLGQPLARMELQVVLGTFARRLPTLRLRDTPEDLKVRTGAFIAGLEDVWVTW